MPGRRARSGVHNPTYAARGARRQPPPVLRPAPVPGGRQPPVAMTDGWGSFGSMSKMLEDAKAAAAQVAAQAESAAAQVAAQAESAAAQAAAQAESAAAQAANGMMSDVMATDVMALAKSASERAAAAAERLNSGITTEDLMGKAVGQGLLTTPVKGLASATTSASTPAAGAKAANAKAAARAAITGEVRARTNPLGQGGRQFADAAASLGSSSEASAEAPASSEGAASAEDTAGEQGGDGPERGSDGPDGETALRRALRAKEAEHAAELVKLRAEGARALREKADEAAALQQATKAAAAVGDVVPPRERAAACLESRKARGSAAHTGGRPPEGLSGSSGGAGACASGLPQDGAVPPATCQAKAVVKMREQKEAIAARDAQIGALQARASRAAPR